MHGPAKQRVYIATPDDSNERREPRLHRETTKTAPVKKGLPQDDKGANKMIDTEQKSSSKQFDRSVCFTFFGGYHDTAKNIQQDFGDSEALSYLNAIIEYALYAKEPEEPSGMLKYCWPVTKANVDASVTRRKRGFSREDTEKNKEIAAFAQANPEATQREIAEGTNCSLGKVNKVLNQGKEATSKDALTGGAAPSGSPVSFNPSDNSNNPSSFTATCNEREHEQPLAVEHGAKKSPRLGEKRLLEDLSSDELEELKKGLQRRVSYNDLKADYNLASHTLGKDSVKEIEAILKEKKEQEAKEKQSSRMRLLENELRESPEVCEAIADAMGITQVELLEHTEDLAKIRNGDFTLGELELFSKRHLEFLNLAWFEEERKVDTDIARFKSYWELVITLAEDDDNWKAAITGVNPTCWH